MTEKREARAQTTDRDRNIISSRRLYDPSFAPPLALTLTHSLTPSQMRRCGGGIKRICAQWGRSAASNEGSQPHNAAVGTHRVPGGGCGGHGRRGVEHAPLQVINLDPDPVKAATLKFGPFTALLLPSLCISCSFFFSSFTSYPWPPSFPSGSLTPFFSFARDKLNS